MEDIIHEVVEVIRQRPEIIYALLCQYSFVSGAREHTVLIAGVVGQPGAVWAPEPGAWKQMVMVEAVPHRRIKYVWCDRMPRVSELTHLLSNPQGKPALIFELEVISDVDVRLTITKSRPGDPVNAYLCCCCHDSVTAVLREQFQPLFGVLENPPPSLLATIAPNILASSSSTSAAILPPDYADTMKE